MDAPGFHGEGDVEEDVSVVGGCWGLGAGRGGGAWFRGVGGGAEEARLDVLFG